MIRAITVEPGVGGLRPARGDAGAGRVRGRDPRRRRRLGVCGTDAEIVGGDYGEAPPGASG